MSKLAEACALSFEEWISTFPETMPKAECSPQHEKWKKKLFNKMRNDRYHVLTTKSIKIMLVAAILCALLMSAFVFPSSREGFVNSFDDFSIFKLIKDNNNFVNSEIKVGYIPEGYRFILTTDFGKNKSYRFENSNGEFFTILKHSSSMVLEYNSENNVSKEFVVNNIKYVYCEGDSGVNNIMWTKNDYVYRITGMFTYNELIEIAKNVE